MERKSLQALKYYKSFLYFPEVEHKSWLVSALWTALLSRFGFSRKVNPKLNLSEERWNMNGAGKFKWNLKCLLITLQSIKKSVDVHGTKTRRGALEKKCFLSLMTQLWIVIDFSCFSCEAVFQQKLSVESLSCAHKLLCVSGIRERTNRMCFLCLPQVILRSLCFRFHYFA